MIRPDTTAEGLAALRPVFFDEGICHRWQQLSAFGRRRRGPRHEQRSRRQTRNQPLGYFRAYATVGVDPAIMGIGPIPAVQKLLKKTGLTIKDIDLFEVNEAFASQSVYVQRTLGIPMRN